jgi:hypothetical protein
MATLQIEQAALLVNRAPEAIERWILDGKVDAERAAGEWLVDSRSLLNAAVSEDVAVHTNGHAHVEAAVAVTVPEESGVAAAAEQTAIAVPAPEPPSAPTTHSDRAIADVATVAIQALNSRLEQAIGEVERLQDERLKLALQLGYAQSQLRQAQDQLRMLAPPETENPLQRLWRRLTGR